MSILVWNVRGMNKKGRRKDAKDHFKSLSPSILALVETKVKLNKLDGLKCCVPHNWPSKRQLSSVIPRKNWIAWNPDIWICNVYVVSIQHITLQVKNKGGLEGYITIVYGLNTIGERIKLWRTLE